MTGVPARELLLQKQEPVLIQLIPAVGLFVWGQAYKLVHGAETINVMGPRTALHARLIVAPVEADQVEADQVVGIENVSVPQGKVTAVVPLIVASAVVLLALAFPVDHAVPPVKVRELIMVNVAMINILGVSPDGPILVFPPAVE